MCSSVRLLQGCFDNSKHSCRTELLRECNIRFLFFRRVRSWCWPATDKERFLFGEQPFPKCDPAPKLSQYIRRQILRFQGDTSFDFATNGNTAVIRLLVSRRNAYLLNSRFIISAKYYFSGSDYTCIAAYSRVRPFYA